MGGGEPLGEERGGKEERVGVGEGGPRNEKFSRKRALGSRKARDNSNESSI
jgi:hypothetical protein